VTDRLLSTLEVAGRLGMVRQSVYELLARGQLRGSKVGRCWTIRESEVLRYMAALSRRRSHGGRQADPSGGYLGTREAAAVLGVTQQWVDKLIQKGRLPAQRVGRFSWVIKADDVAAWDVNGRSREPPARQATRVGV